MNELMLWMGLGMTITMIWTLFYSWYKKETREEMVLRLLVFTEIFVVSIILLMGAFNIK